MLHGEPCITACLNKIKFLNKIKIKIGKHFFRYFKKNLATQSTYFSPVWPFM